MDNNSHAERPAPWESEMTSAQQARRNFSSAILCALVLVLVGVVARCAVVL